MNRSMKTLVATVLVLSLILSLGTAVAQKKQKQPKVTPAAITSIDLSISDQQGNPVSPDTTGGDVYTVISKHRYILKATHTPDTAKASLRWRSSKPRVVSVNNRGVLYCNRPGTADITVSTKNGAVTKKITLNVSANMTTIVTTADKTVSKIYLRGNNLFMDVVLVNSTTEVMETAPSLEFFLKLYGETTFTSQGVKSGHIRGDSIAAGATGTASYKIKKVNLKTINLVNAEAECKEPLGA